MSSIGNDNVSQAIDHMASIAPPPSGTASYRAADRGLGLVEEDEAIAGRGPDLGPRPQGRRFVTALEIAEIDGRGKPGPTWRARGQTLSRRNLVVESRRMCYATRDLVIAVHMIDDQPFPLRGRVYSCDYDGEGVHILDIDLTDAPIDSAIKAWLVDRGRD